MGTTRLGRAPSLWYFVLFAVSATGVIGVGALYLWLDRHLPAAPARSTDGG